MKINLTILSQAFIALIGIAALVFMLWEPHLEGRNAHATLFEIYFKDPFLAYLYIGSIPFFAALFQAFKLLGRIQQNKVFTEKSVRALRNIKYCAIAIIGFIAGAVVFIVLATRGGEDDSAGFVALCIGMIFTTCVVATAAAVFEKMLQNAVDIKSENDLTV